MELRQELMPPALDEATVARLAGLADQIDGAMPGQSEGERDEFNRIAGTSLTFADFQGIYGGQDHDSWVRRLLAEPYVRRVADVSRAELIELARRVMECDDEEDEAHFWLRMLELSLPDPRVSDLIYRPGEYFGDGDDTRELTPEQVVEISQARSRGAVG